MMEREGRKQPPGKFDRREKKEDRDDRNHFRRDRLPPRQKNWQWDDEEVEDESDDDAVSPDADNTEDEEASD